MLPVSSALLALSAICWGLTGGIGGLLIGRGWDPLLVTFYRGSIGLLQILVWLAFSALISRQANRGLADLRLWMWSALAGFGVAGNFGFYFISIESGSVAVAATLMYCAPIFVYLISFALGLEQPTLAKWAAIPLVTTEIILLTRIYAVDSNSVGALSLITGLLAGISYALFIFSFKNASQRGSVEAVLAIAFSVLTSISLAFFITASSQSLSGALHSSDFALFLALGVLGAGVSFAMYVVGLRYSPPSLAAIIAMLEPVTASVFAILVLNEGLSMPQLAGMLLILGTVTALTTRRDTTPGPPGAPPCDHPSVYPRQQTPVWHRP